MNDLIDSQVCSFKPGVWLPETKNGYRVYITCPFADSLVTILVDTSEIKTRELFHLTKWSEDFLILIRGNNEFLSITHSHTGPTYSPSKKKDRG